MRRATCKVVTVASVPRLAQRGSGLASTGSGPQPLPGCERGERVEELAGQRPILDAETTTSIEASASSRSSARRHVRAQFDSDHGGLHMRRARKSLALCRRRSLRLGPKPDVDQFGEVIDQIG